MENVSIIQLVNLVVLVGGGGIGIGTILNKVNSISKQVNGGFAANAREHETINQNLNRHTRQIGTLEGRVGD